MNPMLERMMARYQWRTLNDYQIAVREIMQELALLGLWRGHFFDYTAFYGGTALRILYGLDRGSEDMNFSLLTPARISDWLNTKKRFRRNWKVSDFTLNGNRKLKKQYAD